MATATSRSHIVTLGLTLAVAAAALGLALGPARPA